MHVLKKEVTNNIKVSSMLVENRGYLVICTIIRSICLYIHLCNSSCMYLWYYM